MDVVLGRLSASQKLRNQTKTHWEIKVCGKFHAIAAQFRGSTVLVFSFLSGSTRRAWLSLLRVCSSGGFFLQLQGVSPRLDSVKLLCVNIGCRKCYKNQIELNWGSSGKALAATTFLQGFNSSHKRKSQVLILDDQLRSLFWLSALSTSIYRKLHIFI